MRKKKLVIIGVVLFMLLSGRGDVFALVDLDIYLQAGAMTDDSFKFSPFLWSAGANIDIKVSGLIMISPELNFIVDEFNFDYIFLEPAVTANLKFTTFFIGAGLTTLVELGDAFGPSTFSLKINGGVKLAGVKIRGYLFIPFDDLFTPSIYGISIGVDIL